MSCLEDTIQHHRSCADGTRPACLADRNAAAAQAQAPDPNAQMAPPAQPQHANDDAAAEEPAEEPVEEPVELPAEDSPVPPAGNRRPGSPLQEPPAQRRRLSPPEAPPAELPRGEAPANPEVEEPRPAPAGSPGGRSAGGSRPATPPIVENSDFGAADSSPVVFHTPPPARNVQPARQSPPPAPPHSPPPAQRDAAPQPEAVPEVDLAEVRAWANIVRQIADMPPPAQGSLILWQGAINTLRSAGDQVALWVETFMEEEEE